MEQERLSISLGDLLTKTKEEIKNENSQDDISFDIRGYTSFKRKYNDKIVENNGVVSDSLMVDSSEGDANPPKYQTNPPDYTYWNWNYNNPNRYYLGDRNAVYDRKRYLMAIMKLPIYTPPIIMSFMDNHKDRSFFRSEFDTNYFLLIKYISFQVKVKNRGIFVQLYSDEAVNQLLFDLSSLYIYSYIFNPLSPTRNYINEIDKHLNFPEKWTPCIIGYNSDIISPILSEDDVTFDIKTYLNYLCDNMQNSIIVFNRLGDDERNTNISNPNISEPIVHFKKKKNKK